MQNKLLPIQLICTAICIGLAVFVFTLFKARPSTHNFTQKTETNNSKTFDANNYNAVITDTFISLAKRAYPTFAQTSKQNNTLHVSINGANALTQDFYNGNDNLLKFKLADFGFEIKYTATTKSIDADFKINNNSVNIPNDVLIRLVNKAYSNTGNVQPKK